ncbi:unnamed protein product [Malus baccata var. baccata]
MESMMLRKKQWYEFEELKGRVPHVDGVQQQEIAQVSYPLPKSWVCPSFRTIKVNVDGGSRRRVVVDMDGGLMVEAEAIRAAVLASIYKSFEVVQIKSDSKYLVDMLNWKTQLDVVIEGILFDVQWLK